MPPRFAHRVANPHGLTARGQDGRAFGARGLLDRRALGGQFGPTRSGRTDRARCRRARPGSELHKLALFVSPVRTVRRSGSVYRRRPGQPPWHSSRTGRGATCPGTGCRGTGRDIASPREARSDPVPAHRTADPRRRPGRRAGGRSNLDHRSSWSGPRRGGVLCHHCSAERSTFLHQFEVEGGFQNGALVPRGQAPTYV